MWGAGLGLELGSLTVGGGRCPGSGPQAAPGAVSDICGVVARASGGLTVLSRGSAGDPSSNS